MTLTVSKKYLNIKNTIIYGMFVNREENCLTLNRLRLDHIDSPTDFYHVIGSKQRIKKLTELNKENERLVKCVPFAHLNRITFVLRSL